MSLPDVSKGLRILQKNRSETDDVIAAVEAINKIGGMERATKEAEAALELARKHQKNAEDDVKAAEKELSDAKAKTDTVRSIADKVRSAADEQAAVIVAEARMQAKKTFDDMEKMRAKYKHEVGQLQNQIVAATHELEAVQGRLEKARAEQKRMAEDLST